MPTNIDWRYSDARKILLQDLESGALTLDEEEMTALTAWTIYSSKEAFKNVEYQQFKRQLKAHRSQVKKRRDKTSEETPNKGAYSIDWRRSHARVVLLEDLESGDLPLEEEEMTSLQAWAIYRKKEAFSGLVEYPQFKRQLKAHQDQVKKRLSKSAEQVKALERDQKIHPRTLYNHRGELKFDLTPAKLLLREDMKKKLHETLPLSEFWRTRSQYQRFTKAKFAERIKQEIRRSKFVNWMNLKREEKAEQLREAKLEAIAQVAEAKKKKEETIRKASAKQNNKRCRE